MSEQEIGAAMCGMCGQTPCDPEHTLHARFKITKAGMEAIGNPVCETVAGRFTSSESNAQEIPKTACSCGFEDGQHEPDCEAHPANQAPVNIEVDHVSGFPPEVRVSPADEAPYEPLFFDKWSALVSLVAGKTAYEIVGFKKGRGPIIADGRVITAIDLTEDSKYHMGELQTITFDPKKEAITKMAVSHKTPPKGAKLAFLATVNGKRVLWPVASVQPGLLVPEEQRSATQFAWSHGWHVVSRTHSKVTRPARLAYAKLYRVQNSKGE